MRSALERRQEILEALSDRRFETVQNLATEFGRRYLHNDQEALLRELMDGLQPDQQRIMQSILSSFAKPKVKESMN